MVRPLLEWTAPPAVIVSAPVWPAESSKRYVLCSWLRRAGYTVIEATQGDEQSGGDELAFRYNRTYDDKRLRAALGIRRPPPVPVDADYLSRLFALNH